MAEHHYLPAVKKGTNVPQPPQSGWWFPVSRRDVAAVGQGPEVGEDAKARGVTSVPDVWARPMLFHSAIRPNSDHPLAASLLEEWRGLLSLIALCDYFDFDLQLEPVQVDPRDGPLARALIELAPRGVHLEQGVSYQWLDVLLIRVNEITVGALSPLTLVYTGVRDLPTSLRVVENGRLRTPSDPIERRYVALWAERLRARLQSLLWNHESNPEHQFVFDILELLRIWTESLRRSLGLGPNESFERSGEELRIAELSPDKVSWPKFSSYSIYRELLRPIHVEQSGDASQLLLKQDRSHQDVLVVSPQLLSQDIKVWQSLRSRDLGALEDPQWMIDRVFNGECGERLDRFNLAEFRARWIRPERFFLSNTLLASRSEAPLLSGSVMIAEGQSRRYIFPFRKEILEYFSPQQVIRLLDPKFETADGGVRFSFKLPLKSGPISQVLVQKTYRLREVQANQGNIREIDPPPVYLFPRYRTRHWRRYFIFCGGDSISVESLAEPGTRLSLTARRRSPVTIHQISGDGAFPEALAIGVGGGPGVGLILLEKPAERAGLAGSRAMTIGIDYGTSNTNVFLLPPDADQPSPWSLDLRSLLQPIFEVPDAGRLLADHFLPLQSVKFPVATNLRIFDPALVEHPLFDYFIHFSDDYRLPENVHSDIKWQDIVKTQQFIRSLLLLLLLEVIEFGAKSFKIIFSFPKAFSANQRRLLEQTWEGAVRELTEEPGRLLNITAHGSDPDVLKPQFQSLEREVEAVAAGEYFASRNAEGKYERITIQDPLDRAAVDTTAVCIDVGGGTSDICVWHRNERVLDASILLAGRQVGSWMRANGKICELLFSRDAALALKEVENKPIMFGSRLNQILRAEEQEITKNLIMNSTRPEIDRLRLMLVLEFGAILFYTATLLAGANRIERHKGGIGEDIQSDGINIHWGGNTAKMLRWIDYGKFSPDGFAADILRAVLRNALADAGLSSSQNNVASKESPGHKSEVAGGLIVWDNVKELHRAQRLENPKDDDLVIDETGESGSSAGRDGDHIYLGENIETSEGTIRYDEAVSASRLFPSGGTTIVRAATLERLERFLKIVNQLGLKKGLIDDGKQILLTDQLRVHIGRQVRGEFVTMSSLDPSKRVLEPVFISEVKSLLEVLGNRS